MVEIPFFKKIKIPKFSVKFLKGKPSRVVGIDIGARSTKVVQLRYAQEKAILETYGELVNEGYLKTVEGGGGILRYSDKEIASLLKDVLKESNVTAKDAVISIPAASSFVTVIKVPPMSRSELEKAVPYEARKYIPIPISEIMLDWEIMRQEEETDYTQVLIAAVPREIIDKFKRIAAELNINLLAMEIETFSLIRSLVGNEQVTTAIIAFGHFSTTLIIVDRGQMRIMRNYGQGSNEITRTIERGLNVNAERAMSIKHEIGMSEKMENHETTSIIEPIVETILGEISKTISAYNRKTSRKVQRINLTGGGSNLNGLVELIASKFGIEVAKGNPFRRVVAPAFIQSTLTEIGPSLSVAVGLALREITNR